MAVDLQSVDPQWAWSAYEPDAETPWNRKLAAHLFRRANFGANSPALDDAVQKGPAASVAQLFEAPAPSDQFERDSADLLSAMLATGKPESLAGWWLHRMLNTTQPLREKMTLFWHGHFATSADKVQDIEVMFHQNDLLRTNALEDFSTLAQGISRDPAMLIYLDSATNRKAHPNENYARELMELFCLGEGNYTEKDVQEVARCFTGWEIRRKQFRFNRYQHDTGTKSILGQTGEFGGEDAVRVVLEQPAAPRFIVRKLFRFFIGDEPEASDALLQPLADQLRQDKLVIAPTLRRLLSSRIFYSPFSVGRKVRSPVELAVGLLRSLEGSANVTRLGPQLKELGQALFYPPNVKGWDGGRAWVNTSTLIGRANMIISLVGDENTRFAAGKLAKLAESKGLNTPEAFVDWLTDMLLATPLSPAARDKLIQIASQPERPRACDQTLCALGALPEFQLA